MTPAEGFAVDKRDRRPPMVRAMLWVNRLTSISMEMALPPLAGYWLDRRWGTNPALVIVGAILGMTLAMWHLLKLVGDDNGSPPKGRTP